MPQKWYVVIVGTVPGVYSSWSLAGPCVSGISGAIYQGYKREIDARNHFELARAQGHVKALNNLIPEGPAVLNASSGLQGTGFSYTAIPKASGGQTHFSSFPSMAPSTVNQSQFAPTSPSNVPQPQMQTQSHPTTPAYSAVDLEDDGTRPGTTAPIPLPPSPYTINTDSRPNDPFILRTPSETRVVRYEEPKPEQPSDNSMRWLVGGAVLILGSLYLDYRP